MAIQTRNDEMVSLLSADFQPRYEPNFAWKSACSSFLVLLGLRGFWPFSSFNESGNAYDLSGQGRTLTMQNDPAYNYYNLAPYVDLDGSNDWFDRTDEVGLDISGTEIFVTGTVQGLTIGGWFWTDTLGVTKGFAAKWNDSGVNQRAYLLYLQGSTNTARFAVSTDGTAIAAVTGASISASNWYFIVGRFTTSTDVEIFVNGTWYSLGSGPATVFDSNADLNIGAYNNGQASTRLNGRASLCFLCAAALPDAVVGSLWHQTRAMFGV